MLLRVVSNVYIPLTSGGMISWISLEIVAVLISVSGDGSMLATRYCLHQRLFIFFNTTMKNNNSIIITFTNFFVLFCFFFLMNMIDCLLLLHKLILFSIIHNLLYYNYCPKIFPMKIIENI